MALRELTNVRVEQCRDGRSTWTSATASFAVDPTNPANQRIVDLDRAPRNATGLVTFDADVNVLRPVDGGNRKVLLVIPNRGLVTGPPLRAGQFHDPTSLPTGDGEDGFLVDEGWTIAWCGWQWDVVRSPGVLGLTAPEADVEAGPLRLEWRPDTTTPTLPLNPTQPGLPVIQFAGYPVADPDDEQASLTVRTAPEGQKVAIDRAHWRFSEDSTVTLDGGFQAFCWYELTYRTHRAPVVGSGLLAVRDYATHLRAEGFERVFAFGASQCGRFLRQFLFDGLNVDEAGTPAFDGILSSIAGAARGEFNHRFAQPPLTEVHGFGDQPPFGHHELVRRQRDLGTLPKVIMTNSAWEYWRGDAALQHVDRHTGDDLEEDPDVRSYLIAGTDHFGALDVKAAFPAQNATHALDPTPIHRALLTALDAWVDGVSPPASQVPRTADGTATSRAEVLGHFGHVPTPDLDALPWARRVDLGPTASRGVGRWPVTLGASYPDVVSAVDADGNEVAGVKLPAVSAPCAVYTGWNPRRRITGLPTAPFERLGSRLPFPSDRPAVTERYADRGAYEATAREAASSLVAARLLLARDADAVVHEALRAYDEAVERERHAEPR
ncbi:hypothetical protein CIW49_14930 [Mycolicibacterium sp. P1-18]|uniref:alpha/beta hydrolase domain-containing protein n=1 Tax=Mycolicibacterium sp. P1-18 TaxID=2024615 RepID=UPI0011F0EDB5|nr:alpha/beta hydrolase domain-containing protein [Mycolicibacterium sp. P1-18]KAA0097970.1 hypothetical protein CIW49_14930 [Mycolicibacterium sp. P1-18]